MSASLRYTSSLKERLLRFSNSGWYVDYLVFDLTISQELKLAGEIHSSFDPVTTIKRIQDDFDFLIVTARDCLVGYLKSHRNEAILRSLRDSARLIDPPSTTLAYETQILENSKRIILVSQYYAPPSASSSSTYDVDSALLKNLANPFISDIYLFNERQYQFDHFPNPEKIHQIVLGTRPTFENIFQFVNNYLPNKHILLGIPPSHVSLNLILHSQF